jgi:hypothetical protein
VKAQEERVVEGALLVDRRKQLQHKRRRRRREREREREKERDKKKREQREGRRKRQQKKEERKKEADLIEMHIHKWRESLTQLNRQTDGQRNYKERKKRERTNEL